MAITAIAFLIKATEKILVGSSLTNFVPQSVEALLNFHHTISQPAASHPVKSFC